MRDEKLMKLENKYNSQNETIFGIYILGIILTLSRISIELVLQLLKPSSIEAIIYIIVIVFVYAVILILFRQNEVEKNGHRKNLKNIGKKVVGNIVVASKEHHSKLIGKYIYYIVVMHNEKLTKIYYIENNKAYYILKMLLNLYLIKKEVAIPIDIYVYKNKVYADLDSVDLTKVEGFEEVRKAVESTF